MKSRALMVLFGALISLAGAIDDASAADPPGAPDINNMTPRPTPWSSELVG